MTRVIIFYCSVLLAVQSAGCRNADSRRGAPSGANRPPASVRATLPPGSFGASWFPAGPEKTFVKEDLFNRINGAAELFVEMGFQRLHAQRYRNGESAIDLDLYEMENATAAMGMYFHKRGRETPIESLVGRHTGNRFQITACKGAYFFQINNFSGKAELLPAMSELARSVFSTIPAEEPIGLLDVLSKQGLVAGSEIIVRGPQSLQTIYYLGEGDILELDGRIFGIAGDYVQDDNDRLTQLVIPYGDPARARSVFGHLAAHLDPQLHVIRHDERELVFRDIKDKCGGALVAEDRLELRLQSPCAVFSH
jgi:hypothetical protein